MNTYSSASCTCGSGTSCYQFTYVGTKTFHVMQSDSEVATVKATEFVAKGKNVWFYDGERVVAYFTDVLWVTE